MSTILHLGKYYSPDSGGIESVTVNLAKGAASAGHEVCVVCFDKKATKTKTETIDGIQVIRAPTFKVFFSQPLGFNYYLESLRAARKADIVHLHTPNMLGALCSLFIPRRSRLLVHWHSDVVNKGFIGMLFRPLEFSMLCRANCIIATSKIYLEASTSIFPFKYKTIVVPIGVNVSTNKGYNHQLPANLESQIRNRKIILSVGRLVPYKGFNVLVQATKKIVKDSVVVIVGSGPLHSELQDAIERNGVSDQVILAGRLSDSALHQLFKRAFLFCLPSTSRAEAFGVVLLEAMSHGLPIVATDIPGSAVPWVNLHSVSGLNIPVADADALAFACNQILESDTLHTKLSNGSRQRYKDEFTEDVFVHRVLGIYERLLSNKQHVLTL